VPEHVEDAVVTALQKLPADRFRSAAEFGAALQDGGRDDGTMERATEVVPPSVLPSSRHCCDRHRCGSAFFLGGKLLGGHPQATMTFGRETHVTWDPGLEVTPVISPDGRSVAYAAGLLSRCM
jgi:hypothetical protein